MASKDEIKAFIKRMQALFGPPYKDAEGEIVSILAKRLQVFDGEVLMATAEHFALTREFKTWPMPVEIIAACRAKMVAARPAPKLKPKVDPWSWDRLKEADRLILCDLGVQAAEGGWLDELWDFCRRNLRLPDRHEIDGVCRDAERHFGRRDKTLDRLGNDTLWKSTKQSIALRQSLANLGEKMQQHSKAREDAVMSWAKQRRAA